MGIGIGSGVIYFQNQTLIDPAWRLAIITGLLGALTTFSTFSLEVVGMLKHGQWWLTMGTASLDVLGSLLLTGFGMQTAKM